jgi:tetratricopeptide (TPR) repeat protein
MEAGFDNGYGVRRSAENSILTVLGLVALAGCAKEAGDGAQATADVLARERAAALFLDGDVHAAPYLEARAVLAPLVARPDASADDLVRAANVELALQDIGAAEIGLALPFIERARQLAPDDPSVSWALFRVASAQNELETALGHARRVHELAPDDFPAELMLANTLSELERIEEAEIHYQRLLSRGSAFGGSWMTSVTYRYSDLLYRIGARDEEAERFRRESSRLQELFGTPSITDLLRGTFGLVAAPPPGRVLTSEPETRNWFESKQPGEVGAGQTWSSVVPGVTGCLPIELLDVERESAVQPGVFRREAFEPALLLAWGATGLRRLVREVSGTDEEAKVTWVPDVDSAWSEPVELACAFDVDSTVKNDGTCEVLALTPSGLLLLRPPAAGGSWSKSGDTLLPAGFRASDMEPLDFDHDGDVDLLVVGPSGVRLLRNDGTGFVDASADVGLPREHAARWCLAEDFDADNDVDLLFGDTAWLFYARNQRGGRFSDATTSIPDVLADVAEPLAIDADADGWPDLVVPGSPARLIGNLQLDRWSESTLAGPIPTDLRPGALQASDIWHGVTPTILWPGGSLGLDVASGEPWSQAFDSWEARPADLEVIGVEPAGASALVTCDGQRIEERLARSGWNWVRLALRGSKDNRRGVGAIVEIRVGPAYRRLYWKGRTETIGLRTRNRIDVVTVTWPNGIVQKELDLAAGSTYTVEQRIGLIGSCPFLYAWNGATYTFVSDVLGITPLGLPMAPGVLVPPDHDEYVLIRGDQLVPKDGAYELQLTEELREVTYLDRVRLDVIDHPAQIEILPNERFSFPPFPEPHVHTVRDPLSPLRATDGDGRDWTREVARPDTEYAVPFEPYEGQMLGLAPPHFLELEFDPARVAGARKLRLLCTGWLYWTDASVNMAAARDPRFEFVPPILQVPDGTGGWRDAGPPLGFPAGKLKTMVVDVSALLDRADPRLRLFDTLRLYWDSIRLAVDEDDAPFVTTSIEPSSAVAWERGFSEPIPLLGAHALDWFEWDRLASEPRWNQHPGLYTRYGETLPLVTAIDDRFVILGAGDALTLSFPAGAAPPLAPGWTRDYLLFLDGWAKDRDPNTLEALYVDPLPFHAMSGYPYGPGERYPDDEAHRRYQREWNTRPAKRWIARTAPDRPSE